MLPELEVDVAIVGGGPAGLAAGIALRRAGVERVCVFEREVEAGGVPRHCGHPAFGLREFGFVMTGPAYARRLVARAVREGVVVKTRHTVLRVAEGELTIATTQGTVEVSTRRTIITTGARETPRSAHMIGGDRPIGVLNTGALQSYIYLKGRKPFLRPVVVGSELVSLSALWTCLAHGIRPVALIEPNDTPLARWPFTLFPHMLGISVHYGTCLTEINGAERVSGVTIAGAHGEASLSCDGVLLTGRFRPEAALIRASGLTVDPNTGGPIVDQSGASSLPGCFAAGNVLRPIETAGWCCREGRRTGQAVAASLVAKSRPSKAVRSMIAGRGVAFVVPQRIDLNRVTTDDPDLQVRLLGPYRGYLRILAGGKPVWRRSISSSQERRILIPWRVVAALKTECDLIVDLEGYAGPDLSSRVLPF